MTTSINVLCRAMIRLAAALLLLCAFSTLSHQAMADGTSYSTASRQLKVGILLVDSTTDTTNAASIAKGQENPDPFVFYIADAYNDLKPLNWTFINPLAPGAVTTAIRNRWVARDPNHPYQIGQPVTKNMAAYWEVSLTNSTITDLLQFDLLLITTHRITAFTPADREKLRKLVDAGGIIWLENCGGMTIQGTSPFFLKDIQFQGNSIGNPKPVINVPDHPILNTPYQLSFEEISQLGDKNYGNYCIDTINPASPNQPSTALAQAPNPETLINIIGNGNVNGLPYVAAGNYGGGSVIVTAGDTCCDINDYAGGVNVGYGGNSGAFSGPNIQTAHPEDLKFLYNIAAWGSANNTYRRNNRRMASSFDGVGAPLVNAFSIRNPFTQQYRPQDIVDSQSAPLIVKNVMFVAGKVAGSSIITVRAYDTDPFRDLDGDGNPDDGLPDLSLGLPYDEIWRWTGPSIPGAVYPSAPVYGSVLIDAASGKRQDTIFVTLPDGSVVSLQAFPQLNGVLAPTTNVSTVPGIGGGTYTAMPLGVAPSPTFFENRVYTVEPNGLVLCFNALNGGELWRTFTGNTAPYPIQPCGTPTLGFSQQSTNTSFSRASGGSTNDLMLYVPCITTENSVVSGRIFAYWLGTRNEVVSFNDNRDPTNNANGFLNTRIAGGPGGPQAGQYFMANGVSDGVSGNAAGAFIVPTTHVFSGNRNVANAATAQQNYANGIVSSDYSAAIDPSTGKVNVTLNNGSSAPPVNQNPDVMVAVDYDVAYIVGNSVPSAYASNPTQVGARNNEALHIPSTTQAQINGVQLNGTAANNYGLSTAAFAPDDSLIFGANQLQLTTQNTGSGNGSGAGIASIFSVNEQEGLETSRVRWRYTLFNDITLNGGVDSLTYSRQVDDTTVQDQVPLYNYLVFSPVTSSGTLSAAQMGTAEALINPRIVGSPLTTNNGYTYVMAQAVSISNKSQANPAGYVSVLMAYKTSPQIVLTLPEPFETTRGVTLSQADMLTATGSVVVRSGSPQLLLDGDHGKITVVNSRAANNQAFSASQSFVVRYWPKGGANEKRAVIPPVPNGAILTYGSSTDAQGNQVTATPNSTSYSPLLWYYVLPGQPDSSPTLIGDYVYYTMQYGSGNNTQQPHYVVAVDVNPASNDPQVRSGFGEPVLNVVSQLTTGNATNQTKTNHVRMMQPIDSANITSAAGYSVAAAPPVGGSGILALNTSWGTVALTDNVTLVADNRRLIEVSADSAATWVLDSTLSFVVAGGTLPIYGPNGQPLNLPANGREVSSRTPLSRPTSIQKLNSDYLFADTGNNRVLRADRAGHIVWQLTSFSDPYGLLSNGESMTLNEPTDIQYYTALTYTAGLVTGYEIHYLIADAGNFRIVEVADYYNSNGSPIGAPTLPNINPTPVAGQHVLVWTTRTQSVQGKKLRYLSLQRYLGTGKYPPVTGTTYGAFPYIEAVVGNSNVATGTTQALTESAGGALVRLNYNPLNTAVNLRTSANAVSPQILWTLGGSEPPGNGMVLDTTEQILIGQGTGMPTLSKTMIAPTFFRQISLPTQANGAVLSLICEADGVYVTKTIPATDTNPEYTYVIWMFTQADYDLMNSTVPQNGTLPRVNLSVGGKLPAFHPTSVQLLANGNVLITNGATERNIAFNTGRFVGEAFEVTPSNTSLLVTAITNADSDPTQLPTPTRGGSFANFSAPRLNTGSVGSPNQQVMGNPDSNTGLLEQPQTAIRP